MMLVSDVLKWLFSKDNSQLVIHFPLVASYYQNKIEKLATLAKLCDIASCVMCGQKLLWYLKTFL